MIVNKIIIHELYKPIGTSGAKLSKSKNLLDSTHEDVINLVDELNKRYRRREEKQGIFDKNNATQFHLSFDDFYTEMSDEKFIKFSHRASENLKDRIESIGSAKGGYLVFSLYEDYRQFCSVFIVRDTTGITFKKNKTVDRFDIDKIQHIDFERLAMACRINLELYPSEEKRYLSFIHTKTDELSRYFINWISSTDTVTSEEETKKLLKVLRKIELPSNSENLLSIDRDELIHNAHKHIHANANRMVNLFDLSKNIFGIENYLPDYLYKNHLDLPTEFKAHGATLKHFIKVYAKADNIELTFFPSAVTEGKIKFDENDKNLLIIKSPDLVNQIRTSMNNE